MASWVIQPGTLTLAQLRYVNEHPISLSLADSALESIQNSANSVAKALKQNVSIYGINTGFGLLANTKIATADLTHLQRSIVLSHACGTGELMADASVRLMMLLKINALGRGYSGIRLEVINFLIHLLNAQMYPCVPEKGSVGASGDLAPLAHMCLPLLGEGEVRYQGKIIPAKEALTLIGLTPLTLAAKEGLALLNGTQASTALALQGLFFAEDLFASASVIGAMSVEAALGSWQPFDSRIHQIRGHQGQIDAAQMLRHLLGNDSDIHQSHAQCEKVQDPYSLRCQPQVNGACLTQIRHAADILETEANAVTDNPLVFADTNEILSGGNFHAEPVAMAADNLALAIAEFGAISERRIALLIDENLSNLPAFLVSHSGVNSGFMLAQVTAAALASENKSLAHPAVVDSIPTSANQEDHVSMATFAARRLKEMAINSQTILAIEWLAAAQGLDFREPLQPNSLLVAAKNLLREQVSFYDVDRYFAPDIARALTLVSNNCLSQFLPQGILPSYTL